MTQSEDLGSRASDSLQGMVALVTGVGRKRGIGRALALALAEHGCDLVMCGTGIARPASEGIDDSWRGLDSVAAEVAGLGRGTVARRADVSKEDEVGSLVGAALEVFGRIDILINNAAAPRGLDRFRPSISRQQRGTRCSPLTLAEPSWSAERSPATCWPVEVAEAS